MCKAKASTILQCQGKAKASKDSPLFFLFILIPYTYLAQGTNNLYTLVPSIRAHNCFSNPLQTTVLDTKLKRPEKMQGLAKLREKFGYISSPCGNPDDHAIKATVVISRKSGCSKPGKKTTFRVYSSTHVDNNTGRGKLSPGEASLTKGKKTKDGGSIDTLTYRVCFILDPEFGIPGAIVVKNGDRDEFFLRYVTLELSETRSIHFDCNSWVYPFKKTNTDRVFFFNASFLPGQTPSALKNLRQEELLSLRGNGRGERKEWERIYDYDRYNDLGEPEKGQDHVRPVLGGSDLYPYPRRGRTGRPLCSGMKF